MQSFFGKELQWADGGFKLVLGFIWDQDQVYFWVHINKIPLNMCVVVVRLTLRGPV